MSAKKKRRKIRRTLMIYLDCIDVTTSKEVGKVVDITNEGFLLMSEQPLPIDNKADYHIKLPNIKEFSNIEIEAEGICRWIRKEDLQELYYMGISFVKPDPKNGPVIELLINKTGFSNGQKKIFTATGDIEYK